MILEIKPRALDMLGKHFITESNPQPMCTYLSKVTFKVVSDHCPSPEEMTKK